MTSKWASTMKVTRVAFASLCKPQHQRRFSDHEEARLAVEYISHTKLWERIIRVDWDPGYKEGR
jgi:hypothetical protein